MNFTFIHNDNTQGFKHKTHFLQFIKNKNNLQGNNVTEDYFANTDKFFPSSAAFAG